MMKPTHTIDATGKTLGRLSTQIALLLRGKDSPSFEPHKDEGGFVVVNNASKMKISPKKIQEKVYYHHTGYPKGFRQITLGELMQKKPDMPLKNAVMGMLPKNKLRDKMIKRLTINQ